jgi:hypothetical protein
MRTSGTNRKVYVVKHHNCAEPTEEEAGVRMSVF